MTWEDNATANTHPSNCSDFCLERTSFQYFVLIINKCYSSLIVSMAAPVSRWIDLPSPLSHLISPTPTNATPNRNARTRFLKHLENDTCRFRIGGASCHHFLTILDNNFGIISHWRRAWYNLTIPKFYLMQSMILTIESLVSSRSSNVRLNVLASIDSSQDHLVNLYAS